MGRNEVANTLRKSKQHKALKPRYSIAAFAFHNRVKVQQSVDQWCAEKTKCVFLIGVLFVRIDGVHNRVASWVPIKSHPLVEMNVCWMIGMPKVERVMFAISAISGSNASTNDKIILIWGPIAIADYVVERVQLTNVKD